MVIFTMSFYFTGSVYCSIIQTHRALLFMGSVLWIRGAMVARLTPDQKVACSIHVGFNNRSLLTQIKKLKSDKKSLQNKLDQLINKESLVDKETMIEPMELEKSSDVNIPIMDKGINTDPVNLTTQKDANPTNVKRSSNVEVQTSQGYEEDSIPKVNQEKATSIRSKDQVARMPYRHPNHKSRYFNQSMYQQKQMIDIPKNITSTTSGAQSRSYQGSQNTSSFFQEPYKHSFTEDRIRVGRLLYNSTVLLNA
jgi:hypothetical protein